jgi:hypothetical protein
MRTAATVSVASSTASSADYVVGGKSDLQFVEFRAFTVSHGSNGTAFSSTTTKQWSEVDPKIRTSS